MMQRDLERVSNILKLAGPGPSGVAQHLTPNQLRRHEVVGPFILRLEGIVVACGLNVMLLFLLQFSLFFSFSLAVRPWGLGWRWRLLLLRASTVRALEDFLHVQAYHA